MPTAFITRDLAPCSDFRRILSERGWQVSGQSLVTLRPLAFGSVPPCQWIFFSSQNAVRCFFEQAAQLPDWTAKRAQTTRWAAIGPATARALAEYVERVDFAGTGEPEQTGRLFQTMFEHTSILFPAALHSEKNLFNILATDFQCVHLPVYDNQPLPDPPLRTDDVLVFSSPMNARAYFAQHFLQKKQRAVAIGGTTAAALRSLGVQQLAVARNATEAGLAEAIAGDLQTP